jgi:hydrogenase maturation protease
MSGSRVLVLGYGNPGRRDDGLGPAFASAVAAWELTGVTVDHDYQLAVEDAARVAEHDAVLFADAEAAGAGPFSLRELEPGERAGFSTHSVSPGAVLALARDLFGAKTRAFLLGIRGYDFEGYGEGLSAEAAANLERALVHLRPTLAAGLARECAPVEGGERHA